MDYDVQAKLLRFLQDHEVQRVGAKSSKTVDVRVIAATNRDPGTQIESYKLREDFYYRLSMISIELAPLLSRFCLSQIRQKYVVDFTRSN